MAERRMFAKTIIDSDAFLDMPLSSQALYFHLSMRADDDGFINNPRKVQRMVGSSEDDLKLLMAKRFILTFDSGVIVIKHWKLHNYIRNDRYKPTLYQDEKSQLVEKDNKVYSRLDVGIPDGYQLDTQVRLGKDRLGKDNIKDITPSEKKAPPPKHKLGEFNNVLLTDEELSKLKDQFPDWQQKIDNLSLYIGSTGKRYKSHYMTILSWARKDAKVNPKALRVNSRTSYGKGKPRNENHTRMLVMYFQKEKQFNPDLTIEEYAIKKKLSDQDVVEIKQLLTQQGGQ